MALYRIVIGATLFPALKGKAGSIRCAIGEAQQIRSANYKFSRIFFIRCASPIGGERIAGPIEWALCKRNERIGKARTTVCSASPVVIESPINFAVLTGNGNTYV
jgi:hypothetical protein